MPWMSWKKMGRGQRQMRFGIPRFGVFQHGIANCQARLVTTIKPEHSCGKKFQGKVLPECYFFKFIFRVQTQCALLLLQKKKIRDFFNGVFLTKCHQHESF